MSENKSELIKALILFQGGVGKITKDQLNPYFKTKYADLANYIDVARPVLVKHGLVITQTVESDGQSAILVTTLWHSSGQSIESKYLLKPIKDDPQAMGSALTYARRYSFASILCLAAEDDDGNNASQGDNNQQNNYSKAQYQAQPQNNYSQNNNKPNSTKLWTECPKCHENKFLKSKPEWDTEYYCVECKHKQYKSTTDQLPQPLKQEASRPGEPQPIDNDYMRTVKECVDDMQDRAMKASVDFNTIFGEMVAGIKNSVRAGNIDFAEDMIKAMEDQLQTAIADASFEKGNK